MDYYTVYQNILTGETTIHYNSSILISRTFSYVYTTSTSCETSNNYTRTIYSHEDEYVNVPPPPEIPITDMVKFLSCFNINQSANLTVYAQKMFGGNGVGHAFISITQGNNTMTYGFYPKLDFPSNTNGPGIFGNDSNHPFTYAWNAGTITPLQLQQIIADTIAFSNSDYNVLWNNCSDFVNYVLQIAGQNCNASGIDTPNTISDLISNIAQNTNGIAPQTQRTCP